MLEFLFLLNTHGSKFIHWPFFFVCVIGNFDRPYFIGKELRIKLTKNDFVISTTNFLSWVAISLISMICSHTLLELLCFMPESFFIRVLASALSEPTNYPSIAFMKSLTLSQSGIKPLMPLLMWDLMRIKLKQLDRSHRS